MSNRAYNKGMERSVVTINVSLPYILKQDGKNWVAWCQPIDVVSQAPNREEAIASLKEALDGWFESCIERNVLDEALTEAGFTKVGHNEMIESQGIVAVGSEPLPTQSRFEVHDVITVSIPAYIAAVHLRPGNRATR